MSGVSYDAEGPPFGPIVNGTQIELLLRPSNPALLTVRARRGVRLLWTSDGHRSPNVAGPFIIQNLLILGMAPLIAATVYMSLGRVIKALDLREHLPISPRLMTTFYIIVDVGCFVTQVFGSVMPASGDPEGIALGRNLIIGGLIAQLVALSLFTFSNFHAHHHARRLAMAKGGGSIPLDGARYFGVSYAATLAMLTRALVRGVEYLQGGDGFVMRHEVFLYLFDAVPITLILALYIFIHPGRLVREAEKKNWGMELLESRR
ncbi:RTM1 [Verticillium alfalfae VaMs.102]|uniref:RTM1 n=1 Tax=Verticillium alfalfae (strain VaMs.102 / ATCC MYA-4576 / FGSC 10136) TaxID=526221 RepID=C9SPY9_VERA1|nr:RTM1 [Verticillium alfalfae VaMs.102]EEY20914.1 RTM1 [Verticillium alfalfae VaMs.102]